MSTPEETVQSPALMMKITGIAFIIVFVVYVLMSLFRGLWTALWTLLALIGSSDAVTSAIFAAVFAVITIGGSIVVNICCAVAGYQIFEAGQRLASLQDQPRVQLCAILGVAVPVIAGVLNFGLSALSFNPIGCCTSFFPQIVLLALGASTALMVMSALSDEQVTRAMSALDAE